MSKHFWKIKSLEDIPVWFDQALLTAYLRTVYRVFEPPLDVKIGVRSEALDEFLEKEKSETWAFVTAWNPHSQPLQLAENQRRQRVLKNFLLKKNWPFRFGLGIGENLDWTPEESFLVLKINLDEAVKLGRAFEQNAIVFGEKNRAAELLWLGF